MDSSIHHDPFIADDDPEVLAILASRTGHDRAREERLDQVRALLQAKPKGKRGGKRA